jgi:glycosyltransferase involved in cell wall biosynthesis
MQQYSFIPPKQIYPEAVEVFKKAEHIFFVARRQWHLTERRLLCKFTNAHFTWNPLNLEIPKASLTWPNVSPVQMALVGAFLGHKGQDTALEVLSSSKWKDRDWQLNIYGSGEGEEYLQHLAALYGLQDKVFFHGHVKDIKQVWLQNHILLIPSSQEGLPISLVEAMACARPAVVTDVGGNTELITEDETGFVAVSPSTECYTRAMEKAWMQRSEWEQMGLRCFQQIAKSIDTKPEATLYEMLKSKN